jgi:exopolysaccharide production protein ExoY
MKRTIDILGAAVLLMLTAPLMLVIYAALKPGGPAFYRHLRVGLAGRRFDCLKFRTMHEGSTPALVELLATCPQARREWHLFQKIERDPRITRIGSILRPYCLDELPQLWNVLRVR